MAEHWDRFWTADGRTGSGCLPGADPLERVQREIWNEFAGTLPRGARVLDLGTGDGRVMGWLLERRRDLKPTGIDYARQLPPPPRGAKSRAGISIEHVPFPDASFDAVTSQFGFEYGDIAAAAHELLRLLRPQGRFRLLVHHSSSPIVSHNLARAEGLKWASEQSGAVDKARGLVRARAIANVPTPASFREQVAEARARFGAGSGAEEFSLALLQTLDGSRGAPAQQVLLAIAELEQLAKDERARIAALGKAAADSDRIAEIVALLSETGASVDPPREIGEREGAPPFAWLVEGHRN
jgi:ubiquinone/menaquinone biosynthesis C-methylase UbiE